MNFYYYCTTCGHKTTVTIDIEPLAKTERPLDEWMLEVANRVMEHHKRTSKCLDPKIVCPDILNPSPSLH